MLILALAQVSSGGDKDDFDSSSLCWRPFCAITEKSRCRSYILLLSGYDVEQHNGLRVC